MTHILPIDELRRQFEAGEIDLATYAALRDTRPAPAERPCEECHRRPAHSIQRGRALCGVCGLIAVGKRRRGLA